MLFQNNQSTNNEISNSETHNARVRAPEGVPSIRNWKVRDDGGISGLIYGSLNAENGDYIETSTIAKGQLENGHIVETSSGSRYFLSADSADNITTNIMNAFKSLSDGNRQTGTITMNPRQNNKEQNRRNAEPAMERLENSVPRTTFSLLDLFGSSSEPKEQERPQPPPPPQDVGAPDGVPVLTGWSVNDDGSITGYVYGSGKVGDGNLVTTSLVASGERQQFSVVATVSGSVYFLA